MTSLLTHTSQLSTLTGNTTNNVAYAFDWRQPLLLVYLLYTIPSFIAYYKCRKFLSSGGNMTSGHFNVIFANDFYINVALFLVDFLFTRLPISGLFEKLPEYVPSGFGLTIIYFLSYYLIYANFLSITLICFNRMSSVVFPYSCNLANNQFWQRFVKLAIAMIYILPITVTWQMFTYDAYFLALYNNQSNYQLVYKYTFTSAFLIRNSTALFAVSTFLAVVCVLANVTTIFKYRKIMGIVTTGQGHSEFHRKRTRRTELAMFGIAFVVCFSLVIQAVLQALIMLYSTSGLNIRTICQDLRAFALDIAICCPTWILYYTTVYSHKATVVTSSAVPSRTGQHK